VTVGRIERICLSINSVAKKNNRKWRRDIHETSRKESGRLTGTPGAAAGGGAACAGGFSAPASVLSAMAVCDPDGLRGGILLGFLCQSRKATISSAGQHTTAISSEVNALTKHLHFSNHHHY